MESGDSGPITNNPQLVFLPQDDRSRKMSAERVTTKYLHHHGGWLDDSEDEGDGDTMKRRAVRAFVSNYLYCVILGSISIVSGLLLSVIAFHGLNTSNVTPVMGESSQHPLIIDLLLVTNIGTNEQRLK